MPVIGDVLVNIINEAFERGIFSEQWETVIILPILKISGANKCEKFGPINILSTFEKIMIEDQLVLEFLEFLASLEKYLESEKLFIKVLD